MSERHVVRVPPESSGARLDKWLAEALPDLSRARVQALIAAGAVALESRVMADPARKIKPGETYRVTIPEAAPAAVEAQAIPLTVVFEDAAVIVVDKPAGLVVHPAPGNPDRTLVNALLAHCGESLRGIGGVQRPGIVHRIDKDTSGLLVAAKTQAAHAALAAQFAAHSIERTYDALVWGVPHPARGTITGAIGRSPHDRQKMAVVRRGGKEAETRYVTAAAYGSVAAHVRCMLLTGRTHQIRVHMASRGHPLIGDPVYGRGRRLPKAAPAELVAAVEGFRRQALHAATLGFVHPETGALLRFTSDPPADFAALEAAFAAAV